MALEHLFDFVKVLEKWHELTQDEAMDEGNGTLSEHLYPELTVSVKLMHMECSLISL